MRAFDWLVVVVYITWIVVDGLRRSKATDKVDGYLLANRSLPWWAVGLSVMATQMSAVTIVSTTGLGYLTGLRFVQFYFSLPLAMIILQHVSLGRAIHLAGATGRLHAIDFTVNLTERYTFWSGMIGGLFLMLSYFGCDQSQVQRYLTAKSIGEARQSLMMSAYVKIPLQLLILGTGVLVFVFYLFQAPPIVFNRVHDAQIAGGAYAGEDAALEKTFDAEAAVRRVAAERDDREAFVASDARIQEIRARAVALVRQATGGQSYNDANYVFTTFITTHMPIGLVGLMIAAIFVAAMS